MDLAIIFIVARALGADRLVSLKPLLEPQLAYLLLGLFLYLALARPYVRSRSFVRQTMGTERTASYLLNESGIEVRHLHSLSHYDWPPLRLPNQPSGLLLFYFQ